MLGHRDTGRWVMTGHWTLGHRGTVRWVMTGHCTLGHRDIGRSLIELPPRGAYTVVWCKQVFSGDERGWRQSPQLRTPSGLVPNGATYPQYREDPGEGCKRHTHTHTQWCGVVWCECV